MDDVPFKLIGFAAGGLVVLLFLWKFITNSLHNIGPSKIGLVTKAWGKKGENQLIAQKGEAGYQPDVLMPGWRFKLWPLYKVELYPWVQIPPGGIGVVIAQVGNPTVPGAKTAEYTPALGDFSDLPAFMANGGQRGVQRPVLPPGTTIPMHPVAFAVATLGATYGKVVSEGTSAAISRLTPDQLSTTVIRPNPNDDSVDYIGIVTANEGPPLPSGDMACRLGGFEDITAKEAEGASDAEIIQLLLGTKNNLHNNYQDFEAFLEAGGRIGLQHDPLLYGTYLLNPFLFSVEIVPMLVVNQGEVGVIKSYVGLPPLDTSGETYKHGSIVQPGHRGIWKESLRTGKYPLNPRIYQAKIVPTSILTLNWANATSEAHSLDANLSPIEAKSREAFSFKIDLQVQIHVPDTNAPRVIGSVASMENLVNEVLQSAVGNHFRNKLQELTAMEFIETRTAVQADAMTYIKDYLEDYLVEVRGVYIQDVVFPQSLVEVLTTREIAAQEKETFKSQQDAQQARVALEAQRGEADMQGDLAKAKVSVEIKTREAEANVAEAKGKAEVTTTVGDAEAAKIKAIGTATADAEKAKGLAVAAGFQAQKEAIGETQTAAVAVIEAIAKGRVVITPNIQVGSSGGTGDAISAMVMASLAAGQVNGNGHKPELATVGAAEPESSDS